MIIGLAGAAGCGKSTAAAYLAERLGYARCRFATPLKDMLRAFYRACGLPENGDRAPDRGRPQGRAGPAARRAHTPGGHDRAGLRLGPRAHASADLDERVAGQRPDGARQRRPGRPGRGRAQPRGSDRDPRRSAASWSASGAPASSSEATPRRRRTSVWTRPSGTTARSPSWAPAWKGSWTDTSAAAARPEIPASAQRRRRSWPPPPWRGPFFVSARPSACQISQADEVIARNHVEGSLNTGRILWFCFLSPPRLYLSTQCSSSTLRTMSLSVTRQRLIKACHLRPNPSKPSPECRPELLADCGSRRLMIADPHTNVGVG